MRKLCRVVFVLYVLWLVACVFVFVTDHTSGGPYDGIGKAMAALGAGLPWTLLGLVVQPRDLGPSVLYVGGALAAGVNLALLAYCSWLRRP
jgi:hypothetical protein